VPGTIINEIMAFDNKSISEQRTILNDEGQALNILKTLFQFVDYGSSDKAMIQYIVCMIEGIMEDERKRIDYLAKLQTGFKVKADVIKTLNSVIMNPNLTTESRNSAARLVCMAISRIYENGEESIAEKGLEVLSLINNHQANGNITNLALYMSLTFLLKLTPLQKPFVELGMKKLLGCMSANFEDLQISYNCLVILWELSFRPFLFPIIEERKNEVVEVVKKILQMFRREKIVRIACLFFKNIMASERCVEIMIDVDIYKEVQNLLNRQWQDKELVQNLEQIEKVLNENYKVLSSFEKLKKQVQDRVLKWGPMHTDMFWAENSKLLEEGDFDLVK
jgi:V-ATPase subunit H